MSGQQRREQLLDVTAEIVADQGFQAISIVSVAQRAGVSRPIVYAHFGDLPGLLQALVDREMTQALDQVRRSTLADLSEGNPTELMLESLRTYLTVVEQHPRTWRLVLMPPEGAPEVLRRRIVRGRAAVLEKLIDAVRPGLTPGQVAPDPELTARTLSAIADEYARLVLTDPDTFSVDRLMRHARWFLGQIRAGADAEARWSRTASEPVAAELGGPEPR
jgi:AcrR family transcriptional regulator